jgi:ABC-type transport system involved in multi-copper enzyme maturation permease subunit
MNTLSGSGTSVIARLTFREASRRWVLWVALALGIVFLIVYALGFYEIHQDVELHSNRLESSEIYNFITLAGLYAVNFLTLIMAVLTSVDTLSGEIASGTIHTLVSKPIRRWEIVIGKWLGFTGMLTLYLMLMAGGVLAIVYAITGYTVPNVLAGLALMWLNVVLLLSISLCGGAVMSTLSNGVLVFGLYGIAFIGGWIEQFGSFLHNQTAINIGILSSLIIPSEALWKRATYEMQSPLVGAVGFTPFSSLSTPSPYMIAYAIFYWLVLLSFAVRLFNQRDL